MATRTVVVLSLLALALAAGLAFHYWGGPKLQEMGLEMASEAGGIHGTVRVAGDNYLGYWFLTSRQFQQRLREKGYAVRWSNDGGNYSERHAKFARGEYDLMVLPVNSYLEHGRGYSYPGVITAAVSDSKGADRIVAYQDQLPGGTGRAPAVNDLNGPRLKICLTPDSPSSFLLNIAIAHFALDDLKAATSRRINSDGSEDAFRRFQRHECDAAVLWEPDVSRSLSIAGVAPVFGSDQVSELIIDVFVARRQLVQTKPEMLKAFFQAYFETLGYYAGDHDQLVQDVTRGSEFSGRDAAERALASVAWLDLQAQCRDWFNIGLPGVAATTREKLVDTIVQVTRVLVSVGTVDSDPLGGNPYRITHKELLASLCSELLAGQPVRPALGPAFKSLSDEEWGRLRVIGKLRVAPITFDAGTARLTREGTGVIDQVAAALLHNYPQYRVLVRGHTGPSEEEEANVALSSERAIAVVSYLRSTLGMDESRLRPIALGSREPLPRNPGEGDLSYRNRLARVEFVLVEEGS